jgi:NlpC/P60 family putative phage cell wall peptidase
MTAAASSTEALAPRIVAEARSWIGTPYHHQGSLKGVGCDCIGLVRGVWRAVIGPEPEAMPAYSRDWGEAAGAESLLALGRRYFRAVAIEDMAPGDVVVFRMRDHRIAKHCGILTAPDRFVHAQERVPVAEVAMSDWWRRRVVGAFRFPAPVVIAGPGCCAAHQRCAAGPGDPAIHSLAAERGASRHGMGPRVGAARRPRMTEKEE